MPGYELTAVSRVPQSAGPATLTEIGPIVAPTITWTDRLSGVGALSFSCTPERLESSIRSRFRDLAASPLEVWLHRDGEIVAAGPVLGYQIQGGTLSVTAPDLLAYLGFMWVTSDLAYSNVDQFTIAKGLVDHWQNLAFGDFSIDTSSIGASGVTRDRTYVAVEQHRILQRLSELGAVTDGFDFHVDPATRALVLSHPTKGSDLSASVVLDGRNIIDAGVMASVAAGDIASEAFGSGTAWDADPVTATKSNLTLRASFGRAGIAATFDGVSVQATLDGHTQTLLDARNGMVFNPGPGLVPVADVDVDGFDVGDTVSYEFDAGLGLQTLARRVGTKQVTVDESGNETMAVSFV